MANDKPTTLIEKWFNPIYLREETMQALKKAYAQEPDIPHIQFQDFFRPEKVKTLGQHLRRSHYVRQYSPDMYRYGLADNSKALEYVKGVLSDPLVKVWIAEITGKTIKDQEVEVLRFTQGDYTLLHDSKETQDSLLFIYDDMPAWEPEQGGYDVFTVPDKDPLVVQPKTNTGTLVLLNKETRMFTKYCNSLWNEKKRYSIHCWWK